MNTHDENWNLQGKNPRLYQLVQHAIMKKHAKAAAASLDDQIDQTDQSVGNFVGSFDLDLVVEDHGVDFSGFGQDGSGNRLCGMSFGSSKVYSSVIVAPSFSASVSEEEQN